jgi:hypothetical protein
MRRTLAALLSFAAVGAASARADLPRESDRIVRYRIAARLDAEAHVVTATGTLTWRNPTSKPVEDLWFHLYLNAFRDRTSTFMRESGGSHRGNRYREDSPGSIEVTRLVRGDVDLLARHEFVQPDDGNPDDRTVMRVPLDRPVGPGEEVTLDLAWTSRLPRVFARTGFGGPFHLVAQWYPKLGVVEDRGDGPPCWNCHQFHGSSEFFADYGVYDVALTVSAAYRGRVGATGAVVEEEEHEDGTWTVRFHAADVHDFAWTCDDDTVVFEGQGFDFEGLQGTDPEEFVRVAGLLGRPHEELLLNPVRIRFLLQPEHADQALRHRDAVWHALSYMGLWYGRYPYETLTVVDPDHRADDAGGMEYPTLITGGTGYRIAAKGLTPQFVLVHEFGHQHFYGLLGSNEFEHAWMDEGLTTYATAEVLERAYDASPYHEWFAGHPVRGVRPLPFAGWLDAGPRAFPHVVEWLRSDVGLPVGGLGRAVGWGLPERLVPWPSHEGSSPLRFLREVSPLTLLQPTPTPVSEHERARNAGVDLADPVVGTFAWHHVDRGSYANNSYRRTASALRTLRTLVGEAAMVRILRTYGERFRFRHPTPDDLFGVVTEVAAAEGQDVAWFLDAAFRGTEHLDFGVERVLVEDVPGKQGEKESTVTVRRFGGIPFPTEVRVQLEDGTVGRYLWRLDDRVDTLEGPTPRRLEPPRGAEGDPSQGRWVTLRFAGVAPVLVAQVDPERKVGLDRDRTNDGRRAQGRGARAALRPALHVLGWTEMNAAFYGGL